MKHLNGSTGRSPSGRKTDSRPHCKGCEHYWCCMERSRDYPCTEYKATKEKKDEK